MQTWNHYFYRSLNSLPMLYKESINNVDIAYLLITTSTVLTPYVDCYLFSLIETPLNVKYISNFMENIKCVFRVNVYTCICVI